MGVNLIRGSIFSSGESLGRAFPPGKSNFGNLHQVDLKEADVVTIFLYSHVNDLLQEKFQRELKPGARIVSMFGF